jgi:hypothetical protein
LKEGENKMKLKEFGTRLEQIENRFVKVWNAEVPDWMVRDANIKRNKEVGELLKDIKQGVK